MLDKYAEWAERESQRELLRHATCDRCVFFEAENEHHDNRCHHTATLLLPTDMWWCENYLPVADMDPMPGKDD